MTPSHTAVETAGETAVESEESRAALVAERDFADRRLAALAQAVRQHEGSVQGSIPRTRSHDRRLYTRLRDICGERLTR